MSNSYLSDAAAIAGEGLNRGLTKEEVVDLLDAGAENKRAALRGRIDERRAGRAQREGNREAAEDFLSADNKGFQAKGAFIEQERYPDPAGIPVSGADKEYVDPAALEADFDQQRGIRVFKDEGRGFKEFWRENAEETRGKNKGQWVRGKLHDDKKFVAGRVGNRAGLRPDLASEFAKPVMAPQAAGLGGSRGLDTKLIDYINANNIDIDTLIPGSSSRTYRMLLDRMAMDTNPEYQLERDRAEAAKAAGPMSESDLQNRATIEARVAASAQGNAVSPTFGDINVSMSPAEVESIRREGIRRNANKAKDFELASPNLTLNREVEADLTPVIAEQLRRANAGNPQAVINNNLAVAQEAYGYSIAPGQSNLDAIENIQSLGLASKKFNRGADMSEFSVVPGVDPSAFDDATQMIGPNGETVGFVDNNDKWLADVNIPDGTNTLNAPSTSMASWLETNLPDVGRAGGTSFGMPQVNPGNELRMLNERLGNFGMPTGIRGLNDLEAVVRKVVTDAAFSGKSMWNFDSETNKVKRVQNPGLAEVLYGLDYTQPEITRLAQSLQMVETAMLSPVNSLQKELFAAGITPEALSRTPAKTAGDKVGLEKVRRGFENQVQIDRITGERVGRGKDRKGVRGQLRNLDGESEVFKGRPDSEIYGTTPDGQQVMLPEAQQDLVDARIALNDAQQPFQGAVAGESPERARFVGKAGLRMSPSERVDAWGGDNAERVAEVIRRAAEDEQLRNEAEGASDPRAALMRQKNEEFEAAGAERKRQDVFNAKIRLRGNQPLGHGIPHVIDGGFAPAARKATSAIVNHPTDSSPLEARGVWMGGDNKGAIVNPWSSPDNAVESPPRTRKEREINIGATQGPRTPGIRQKIMNSIKRSPMNFRKAPKEQRYGAIAGGALLGITGIDGLVNNEKERRQEEAQY